MVNLDNCSLCSYLGKVNESTQHLTHRNVNIKVEKTFENAFRVSCNISNCENFQSKNKTFFLFQIAKYLHKNKTWL